MIPSSIPSSLPSSIPSSKLELDSLARYTVYLQEDYSLRTWWICFLLETRT